MGKVIAIDGPSGAGKSTVSRLVAEKLGFRFLDTGALYRTIGLYLKRKKVDPDSPDSEILQALDNPAVQLDGNRVFLDGEDVSDAIRTPEAGEAASQFSAKRTVRTFLLQRQRDAALQCDIVAEGRDMTTVVFPDAWKKFYLDATELARAKRRYLQLTAKGTGITMEDALQDVRSRDKRDMSRDVAPLRKAEDAIYIDTTEMSLDEVIEKILMELKS